MAGTLPILNPSCCTPDCDEPVSVAVPGPPGDPCDPCEDGAPGQNAFTTFAAAFTMPAADGASSAVATVGSTAWMSVGEILYAAKMDGSVIGYFQVTAIGGATSVTLLNLENTATGVYASNSAPASVFDIGSKLQPGGAQGPAGLAASTTIAGQVTGTLAASELTVAASIGALPVGNGSEAQSLAKGTEGHALVVDTAGFPLDIGYKQITPITDAANFNIIDNRLGRLDGTTGLPIPIQGSMMGLTDTGALQSHFRIGAADANAKGADAVDLQSSHNAITQVAAGPESVVSGGRRNTNDAIRAVIGGGDTNTIAGLAQEATISGGSGNSIAATGIQAVIGGGDTNSAAGEESVIGGGDTNSTSAAATNAVVGGGNANAASGVRSTISGGSGGIASATGATVGGGQLNTASGIDSTVAGGLTNTAGGQNSTVTGGYGGVTDKYGQRSHAAGYRSAYGDAQLTDLLWRQTAAGGAGAPNVQMLLDGFGGVNRATIPDNRLWAFEILVTGRTAAFVCAAWRITGAIQNIAGAVSLVSAVTTTVIADGTGATWGVAGNVVVEAGNAPDILNIRVGATVDPGATTHWTATARIIENG